MFLAILLVFNTFGLSIFYLGEIQLCKIKAEEYVTHDYLTAEKKLILFKSDNKRIKITDDNEIYADGKWYDIVKTQTSNGKTVYYTLSDKDEDAYVQNLTNLEKNSPGDKSLPGKIIKLYDAKYFTVEKYHHFNRCFLNCTNDLITSNDAFLYPLLFRDIFSPPPDHLIS